MIREIRIDAEMDPAARRALVLRRAAEALREGDVVAASELETEALDVVDGWLAKHRTFDLLDETAGERLVLRDADGEHWIASRISKIMGVSQDVASCGED